MSNFRLDLEGLAVEIIKKLRESTARMVEPAASKVVQEFGRDPFLILVSCILSLRTKDSVSFPASCRLFQLAKTPKEILDLEIKRIQKVIYPVGFYRQKAKSLHEISGDLIARFAGRVPDNEKDLLSFKGVGRKTANLVLGEGFGMPAICVDTHVHRISNRLGLVKTKTPDETEKALKKILPKKYWVEFNRLLVQWGQNVCVPVSPFCSKCAIFDLCKKVGVKKSR
ncbi:endonuclease III domain-containing protein [Candidatus Dependentiae bacterium]